MRAFRRPILVNHYERVVDEKLIRLSKRYGARVFPKVGLKDALPISESGLTDSDYRYALMAHFDFLVADENHRAVIAVEFDGGQHRTDPKQIERDKRKNRICEHFLLPILRAGAPSLQRADHRTLLEWVLEVWFERRSLFQARDAAAEGNEEVDLPDVDPEDFDYATYGELHEMRGFSHFAPLDAFGGAREKIGRFYWEERKGIDEIEGWYGRHPDGHHLGYLALGVEPGAWIIGSGCADLRGVEIWLGSPLSPIRVAQDIALLDLARKLDAWKAGQHVATSTEGLEMLTSWLNKGLLAPLPLPDQYELTEIVMQLGTTV